MSNPEEPPKPEPKAESVAEIAPKPDSVENNPLKKKRAELEKKIKNDASITEKELVKLRGGIASLTTKIDTGLSSGVVYVDSSSKVKKEEKEKEKTWWQWFKGGSKSFGLGTGNVLRGLGVGILVWLSQAGRFLYNEFTSGGHGGRGGGSSSGHH